MGDGKTKYSGFYGTNFSIRDACVGLGGRCISVLMRWCLPDALTLSIVGGDL